MLPEILIMFAAVMFCAVQSHYLPLITPPPPRHLPLSAGPDTSPSSPAASLTSPPVTLPVPAPLPINPGPPELATPANG